MPDLTIITVQQCSDLDEGRQWSVGGYTQYRDHHGNLRCSCKGFKFHKTCKHVKQIIPCHWHEQFDGPPAEDGKCPECGGPTSYVRVAV